ncbi:MAG: 4a-hydroxytetrahydrobiopterin dehydratase [Flavobacteriales bacterium]|nr:4a-hydroxytetrahydrobiopterin dehydratase [Flavobacteriales bacterium]
MWKEQDNKLVREYRFQNFVDAFSFLSQVAKLAEIHGHHPTIINTYSYVRLELNTHDAGGVITEKDRSLSVDIDKINIIES